MHRIGLLEIALAIANSVIHPHSDSMYKIIPNMSETGPSQHSAVLHDPPVILISHRDGKMLKDATCIVLAR